MADRPPAVVGDQLRFNGRWHKVKSVELVEGVWEIKTDTFVTIRARPDQVAHIELR